ncbi:MAG: YggT family protein [Deltaproteobacteria bacterium]
MLHWLLDLYSLVLFVAIILSWVNLSQDNALVKVVQRLTEPVLAPVRRVLPAAGGFDLSPLVVLFAIRLLQRLL